MIVINTQDITPAHPESRFLRELAYNGLDCGVTLEILPIQLAQMDWFARATYEFEMELMGPILDMNMRGVKIDIAYRDKLIEEYQNELEQLEEGFNRICFEGLRFIGNWRSNKDLYELLYNKLSLPVQFTGRGDDRRPTTGRAALERLSHHFHAQPIIGFIFGMRDLGKKLAFLRTGIDPDDRIRTGYNIGGTKVGRLSSSFSDFGTGTNLQNIEPRLRRIFIPDTGHKFLNIDLEQSDSRAVGAICWNLFHAGTYLDACETGDLHTSVSKLVWPHVNSREDANRIFYRNFSYRDTAKRLGHGTNFMGGAQEMARETRIQESRVSEFQTTYLTAFPEIQRWWNWVKETILNKREIISLVGRRRLFFGRPTDQEVIKSAVAYEPANITADTLNRGLLNAWRDNSAQLLLQVHDSILFQFPEQDEDRIVPLLRSLVTQSLQLKHNRTLTIPCEAQTGWNWAYANKDNPRGLSKYSEPSSRTSAAA